MDAWQEVRESIADSQLSLQRGLERCAAITRLIAERDASKAEDRDKFAAVYGMGFGEAQAWVGKFAAAMAALTGSK